jgi:hypothetical protein
MKTLILVLTLFSTLLVSCDRQTLDGLRLNFQGEVKSDYQKKEDNNQQQSQTTPPQQQQQPNTSQQADKEVQPTQAVNSQANPDGGIPFSPLEKCSQGGMVAQTNQLFYQRYPELKSIDSKDQQLMKEWKKTHTEVQQQCNSKR